jgi:hypothetical protein
MRFLFEKKCCESVTPDGKWSEGGDRLRITTLGAYHVNVLLRSFIYLDAMVIDTPIIDDHFRKQIQDVWPIKQRLDRGYAFVSYLADCADSIRDVEGLTFLHECLEEVVVDMEGITARV